MKLGAVLPMGLVELMDYVGLNTSKLISDRWQQCYLDEPISPTSNSISKLVSEGKLD